MLPLIPLMLRQQCFFGTREDTEEVRFYGGDMAEWFKVDRALGANERVALANGASPSRIGGSNMWYLPMLAGSYAEYRNGLTVSNTGSTAANHVYTSPPFGFYPGWQGNVIGPDPAGSGAISLAGGGGLAGMGGLAGPHGGLVG